MNEWPDRSYPSLQGGGAGCLTLRIVALLSLLSAQAVSIAYAQGEDSDSDAQLSFRKVGVVLLGDADAVVEETCSNLYTLLEGTPDVVLPSQSSTRQILCGQQPSDVNHGLEPLYSRRMALGWNETRDLELLSEIADFLGAFVMIVVRRIDQVPKISVFDAQSRTFYRRSAPADADPARLLRFLEARILSDGSRVQPTRSRSGSLESVRMPQSGIHGSQIETGPQGVQLDTKDKTNTRGSTRTWLRRAWPYLAGSAVAAAGVIALAVRLSRSDGSSEPMLRFEAGAN